MSSVLRPAAIETATFETVRWLLALGPVDVDVRGRAGETLLHVGATNGDVALVELLLNAGAQLDVKNVYGETALHKAFLGKHEQVAELLLRAGSSPTAVTQFDKTPLHIACSRSLSELARVLLVSGADLNAKDHMGYTPLHLCLSSRPGTKTAVDHKTLRTIQVLVSFGAKWDRRCDKLVQDRKARAEAPALRTCINLWSKQHRRARPFTDIPPEAVARGAKAVEAFVQGIENIEKQYRRKIRAVGSGSAGKTSMSNFIQTKLSSLQRQSD